MSSFGLGALLSLLGCPKEGIVAGASSHIKCRCFHGSACLNLYYRSIYCSGLGSRLRQGFFQHAALSGWGCAGQGGFKDLVEGCRHMERVCRRG